MLKRPEMGQYVRGLGRFVEMVHKPVPPKPPDDFVFEEIHAQARLLDPNWCCIKEYSTFWDFRHEGSSIEDAIDCAKEQAGKLNLGPSSDLRIIVIKTTSRTRKQPQRKECVYSRKYEDFKADDCGYGCKVGMPDDVEETVWDSKTVKAKRVT